MSKNAVVITWEGKTEEKIPDFMMRQVVVSLKTIFDGKEQVEIATAKGVRVGKILEGLT